MTDAPAVIINLPGYPFDNLPSVATIPDLRARVSANNANGDNVVVDGGVSVGDGLGGLYVWAASSTEVDNGASVIRPTDRSSGEAGRYILSDGHTADAALAAAVASATATATTQAGIATAQALLAAASSLSASGYSAAAALAAATSGVYINAAATNIPRGAAINVLTPGSGGTNGTNYVATYTGGNYTGNPTILYDVVAGAVANVRLIDPGLYIGASPTAPTVVLGSGAGSPALTLTNVFRIGTGSGYWVQSADNLTLDRYKNVAGVATADTGVQSLPTNAALTAAIAALANSNPAIDANLLQTFTQHPNLSGGLYSTDGSVSFNGNRAWTVKNLTAELLAARVAGTLVTFTLEVVSGTLTTVDLREYTAIDGAFGVGSVTTSHMVLSAGHYTFTKALVSTTLSLDIFVQSSGTAVVRTPGSAIGGPPAKVYRDPTLYTAQSLAADAGTDPAEIPHTETLLGGGGGTVTLANGVLTVATGGIRNVFYAMPQALADGDTVTMTFKSALPIGGTVQVGTNYGPTGGSGPNSSVATAEIDMIGRNPDGTYNNRCTLQILSANGTDKFYAVGLAINNSSAPPQVLSAFRFFKGNILPRSMTVPTNIANAITTAVQAESDAGMLVRRMWIPADSVFAQPDIYSSADVALATYLGPRARVKCLAVSGSGLRAMISMAGMPAPTVTITGNQIPASGSVQVTAWSGDPLTQFYGNNPQVSTVFYLKGVRMNLRVTAWDVNFFPTTMYLDRITPGPIIPAPAGSLLIGEQAFALRDDFVMLEGSINPSNPGMTVLQGAAAFFAARDAIAPTTHSLFMPNLIGVFGVPTSQNPGHSNTAALVALYGANRILDLNAAGIPGGNYLTTAEAAMLAAAGFSPDATDNTYMSYGYRPPGLTKASVGDYYHPNALMAQLIAYRLAFCTAMQNYMENIF